MIAALKRFLQRLRDGYGPDYGGGYEFTHDALMERDLQILRDSDVDPSTYETVDDWIAGDPFFNRQDKP